VHLATINLNHHKQGKAESIAMKVYSLSLLALNAATPATSTLLCQVNDLSSFSFYQRGSVGEFMGFFTKVSRIDSTGIVALTSCSSHLSSLVLSLLVAPLITRRQSPREPNQTPPHQSKKTHTKRTSSVPLPNPENHPSAP
jgi:hypothetical protein